MIGIVIGSDGIVRVNCDNICVWRGRYNQLHGGDVLQIRQADDNTFIWNITPNGTLAEVN